MQRKNLILFLPDHYESHYSAKSQDLTFSQNNFYLSLLTGFSTILRFNDNGAKMNNFHQKIENSLILSLSRFCY